MIDTKRSTTTVVIDDGTQEIPIVNKFGKLICKVHIRPGDWSILDRYEKFIKDINAIIAPLQNIDIDREGNAETESGWKTLKSVEADIKKRFNELFDMDEADEIFAKRNAFSSVHGEFYCTKVLVALGSVIASTINMEVAESKRRTEKYLTPAPASDTENGAEINDARVFTTSD